MDNLATEPGLKQVFLTTYSQIRSTLGRKIKDWKFQVLICDEAHHCKNENTSTAMAVLALCAKYRLLITGMR